MAERGAHHDLTVVHIGAFSGITPSLVAALRAQGAEVGTHDLSALARSPRALPRRFVAQAASATRSYRWTRTATWARAVSREVAALPPGPLLFMQTVLACEVRRNDPYLVFTDRVTPEGHSDAGSWAQPASRSWLEMESHFLRHADHVFAMGPSTRRALTSLGISASKITVTGSGVNASLPAIRDRSGQEPDRLLFLGKEWDRKGGPELIHAMKRVWRETQHRPMLDVVGCSPEVAVDFCNVLGRVDPTRLAPLLDRAAALAMPSRSEAFGVAYVEALQAGLPVLASSVSNIPWIVGEGGLCADPTDAEDLFRKLSTLLTDYSSYAAAAFARGCQLRKEWSWSNIATQVLEAISVTPS